jgi:hypothetical protein
MYRAVYSILEVRTPKRKIKYSNFMDNSSSGPIYGQPLPKQSLPIGGNMFQALPTSQDLQSILNSKLPCRMRVVGGYEVMAGHLNALKIENEKLRKAAELGLECAQQILTDTQVRYDRQYWDSPQNTVNQIKDALQKDTN